MNVGWLFFRFDGRINRARFWLGSLVVGIVAGINTGINRSVDPDVLTIGPGFLELITFTIGIALLWPWLALWIKRWHDRGKSGWWMLIVLIPIVGGLWALVECGFLRGTSGANRFGSDPLAMTSADPQPVR